MRFPPRIREIGRPRPAGREPGLQRFRPACLGRAGRRLRCRHRRRGDRRFGGRIFSARQTSPHPGEGVPPGRPRPRRPVRGHPLCLGNLLPGQTLWRSQRDHRRTQSESPRNPFAAPCLSLRRRNCFRRGGAGPPAFGSRRRGRFRALPPRRPGNGPRLRRHPRAENDDPLVRPGRHLRRPLAGNEQACGAHASALERLHPRAFRSRSGRNIRLELRPGNGLRAVRGRRGRLHVRRGAGRGDGRPGPESRRPRTHGRPRRTGRQAG